MPGRTGKELQRAKANAAERFQEIALLILQDAGVNTWTYHEKGLRGRAWPKKRHVVCPKPTTRRRLYILAHECAHVALHHIRSKPSHRQEFEAELFAHQALTRYDIAVPQQESDRARGYVAYRIDQAIRIGRAKRLDRAAVEWSIGKHGAATKRALRDGTVELVDLGGRKREQKEVTTVAGDRFAND